MRLRNLKDTDILLNSCSYLVKDYKEYKGNWSRVFNNTNPIYLEIGMGKGDFIYNMAKKYPNINFIGVEKYSGVLARTVKKYPVFLDNLRIINTDALELRDVFFKEIDTIFLNFSDPWPKSRHSERRLSSYTFLSIYDSLFKSQNKIIMKTDNKGLFESSIVSLSMYGYKFNKVSLDLENSDIDNVVTEYEDKFIKKGVTINYFEAVK